jgi:hypothetical protein
MSATKSSPPQGSGGFKSSPGPNFGTLAQVFDDVWWAWGTTRFMPGVLFPRNMTIIREASGELVIVHPVLLPEAEQAKVEALGPIKHIVRLGAFHGMDDLAYLKRYSPTLWAPPGVDLPPGITTHRELRSGELPLAGAKLAAFEKSRTPETAILLDRHGGLLLTCDSVQNWETTDGCSFLGGIMARTMGFRGRACIGPGWRKMCEPKDGRGFAPDFERVLDLDFRHIIGGHGAPMRDTAKRDLEAQVRRLYPVA